MWIFTRYGFFSLSAKRTGYEVRARKLEHLLALKKRFGIKSKIMVTPFADYSYRFGISQPDVARMMAELVSEQTWDNFKHEAQVFAKGRDKEYLDALFKVWWKIRNLQEDECMSQQAGFWRDKKGALRKRLPLPVKKGQQNG